MFFHTMKKILKKISAIIILVVVLGSLIIVMLGHKEYQEVTREKPLEQAISELQEKKYYVSLDEIPDMVERAMIGVEDKRFYSRKTTLDYWSLGRATWENIKAMKLVEGGSTIPQQVSKNLYFDHSASFVRKVSEFFVTRDLLKLKSKEDILELYLNVAYFGDGYTGIGEAALGYFSIPVEALSDAQATLLVGIVQSPANYELSHNYERAKERQKTILTRLVEQDVISELEAIDLYNEDVFGG